jgi:putative membrane protein
MKEGLALAAALLLVSSQAGFAQSAPSTGSMPSTPSASAKAFLAEAIQSDAAKIKLGALAEKNGGSLEMRDFGKTLVIDHTQAQQQAKATAQQLGVATPDEPTSQAQNDYDRLAKISGRDFDREFSRHLVDDHEKDLQKFKSEADMKNGPTSALAAQQLPTLERHLQMAQTLEQKQQADLP